jgi:hypothetical protein
MMESGPESNPSVARVEVNTKKIRGILCPSILLLFLGPLVKGGFVKENTQLLRTSKEWRGLSFFFVSSIFLLPFYLPPFPSPRVSYVSVPVLHNYVPNSDEDLVILNIRLPV